MTTRSVHWPDGIPSYVRLHPNGDITPEQMDEEARGWIFFVTKHWVPREAANIPESDEDYEVRQRRKLVETWAGADQGFRDYYHRRAPEVTAKQYPPLALKRTAGDCPKHSHFMCLAPLSPAYRSNLSKWIKLYILSCRLDGELGHCMDGYGIKHQGVDPNPSTFPDPSTFQYKDLLPYLFLEGADFYLITMTSKGTVLFTGMLNCWFLVDQEDLDGGLITCVDFKPNGEVEDTFKRRAYNMWPVYLKYMIQWRSIWELKDSSEGGWEEDNTPLDMTLPVIDILEGAKEREEFVAPFDGARDVWEDDIEIYAPGYLQMEAEGNEADYDHSRLIDPMEAYRVREMMDQEETNSGR